MIKSKMIGIFVMLMFFMIAVLPVNGFYNHSIVTNQSNELVKDIKKLNNNDVVNIANNVKISTSEYDDLQPSLTIDSSGRIVVAFATEKGIFDKNIKMVYSEDGLTWMDANSFISDFGVLNYPSIVGIPESNDIGFSYMDPFYEFPLAVYRIGDITDTESYIYNAISWGETEDYDEVAVSYVNNLFITLLTNHNLYLSDLPGCPYIAYWDENLEFPTEIGGNYFDGQSGIKTSPASNIDLATGSEYFYLLMEHWNETRGRSEIAFKKTVTDRDLFLTPGGGRGGMDKYADIEAMPWQFYLVSGDFDAKDPSVSASGNNVVVAYMTNDNIFGDWDIRCAYSFDDGETFETSILIEEHPSDEVYPEIYLNGNNVFCSYVNEGNLFLVKSEDGGATWGEPEQISEVDGTVIEEPRSVEMSDAGIVWTDEREGNKDIYYMPLPVSIINIVSISGGFGISVVIENSGSADAIDIKYTIDLDGLVLVGSSIQENIDIPAGQTLTVNSGFIFGFGKIIITVNAGKSTKTAEGTLLGPFVIGI